MLKYIITELILNKICNNFVIKIFKFQHCINADKASIGPMFLLLEKHMKKLKNIKMIINLMLIYLSIIINFNFRNKDRKNFKIQVVYKADQIHVLKNLNQG